MQKLFIPYKLSLKLRKKGFNEPCFAMYQKNKKLKFVTKEKWFYNFELKPDVETLKFQIEHYPDNVFTYPNGDKTLISSSNFIAPLYQQVVDWFRDKHNVWIDVRTTFIHGTAIYGPYLSGKEIFPLLEEEGSYYEALDKAIEEAIKLI